MQLTGQNFIGMELSGKGKDFFYAMNPADNTELPVKFHEATKNEIDQAIVKAEKAFTVYSKKNGNDKAFFLETIAEQILELGDELIQRCSDETGLPAARLTGERGRTVNQLKMFAELLREGSWVDARIETANPERQPLPKPDIRSMQKALGPVGVFGASNFPLAFSVAGGDTASALAAGCTVVVKAHPAHPGTCEFIAHAITQAAKKTNMPDGVFSMIHSRSNEVGMAIVKHPLIKAIGFTGSFKGGKAIYDEAVRRQEPIPVYAEMGSTNPIFILPGAMRERKEEIAQGLTASVTLGVGQFCTNPGLVFYEDSDDALHFQNTAVKNFNEVSPGIMLTKNILQTYNNGLENSSAQNGVKLLSRNKNNDESKSTAALFQTEAKNFLTNKKLEEEIFGPATLTVIAESKEEIIKAAQSLSGHLTATIHATDEDLKNYKELIEILERKSED